MAEWAGLILDIATCLFSCAKAQAIYVYKLEENVVLLKRKWSELQNKEKDVQTEIQIAESTGDMEKTNEVIGWLQNVRNLEEEMKDIPDIEEVHNKNCLRGYCAKNCVVSYKLGKKTVEILNNVESLLTKIGSINIVHKLQPKPVDEMPDVETVGLDLMLNQVWNSIEDENVGIIGIHGMGGCGKTTLLRRILNEFGKRKHNFDRVLWVLVPKDCDINKIMNDIRNKLGVDDNFWSRSDQHQKVAKIYHHLKQKKFVLMLDDLWGGFELESVGVPTWKETNSKCKVLFTTRYEDVCDKMHAQKIFKVEFLSPEEAFDLFCKKVGNETLKCHIEIPNLAEEMAKDCKGLPLALVTVGSAMAGVKSIEAWRQAKDDLSRSPWIAQDYEKKVFSILKFSYDKLPDETHKSCFRYCALYPEDREIDVDDLIDRWIGEGFLGKDTTKKSVYDMMKQGKSIIEKLKLSNLVIEGTKYYSNWGSSIKMHDVVRDMALWLARIKDINGDKVVVEEDKVVVEEEVLGMYEMDSKRLKVVERISIMNSIEKLEIKERISILNSIRKLNIEESFSMKNPIGIWRVPDCPNLITLCLKLHSDYSNLKFMKRLKVLDLSSNSSFDHVPLEIGELEELEFLNLSRTNIQKKLPIELKNLKNLRVFLMEYGGCGLAIIPLEVIGNLKQLRVFRFTTLNISSELIRDFDQEEESQEGSLDDKLRDTHGVHQMSARRRSRVRDYDQEEESQEGSSVGELRNTKGVNQMIARRWLQIQTRETNIPPPQLTLPIEKREEEFLKKLESLPKLEELCIQLTSIKGINKLLHSTKLRGCSRHFKLYDVWESLEMSLLLESFQRMRHLDRISLSFLRNIREGQFNIVNTCHLGMLRLVEIECCHNISHLTWLKYAPLLESINVLDCNSIVEVVSEAEDGDEANSNINIFPNLIHLRLMGLPKLKRIHERALDFPSLKYVIVSSCPNLRTLPFSFIFAARNNLITIEGEDKWWNKLQWGDTGTTIKNLLHSKFQPLRF